MPPRMVGRYEVLSVIGRGGIGTVYRARHRDTGEHAAVKLLGPPPACDPGAARRLAREFEALHGLAHPNVIRVFEAGVQEGYSYLVMELVEGLDLRSYLSPALDDVGEAEALPSAPPAGAGELAAWSDEPLTESFSIVDDPSFCDAPGSGGDDRSFDGGGPEAIRAFADLMEEPETDPGPEARPHDPSSERAPPAVAGPRPLSRAMLDHLNRPRRVARLRDAMVQVCDALSYVHRRGLVHRDLKPSNIMVDDLRRVRLMDFGLVKLAGDDAPRGDHHHHVVGTYLYMAPEQAHGETVDDRADLYSLGVVLYELLCGRPPFFAPRPSELWEAIGARPPPAAVTLNPGVDPGLAYVAERLLAKHPRERFQTADEVAAALAR